MMLYHSVLHRFVYNSEVLYWSCKHHSLLLFFFYYVQHTSFQFTIHFVFDDFESSKVSPFSFDKYLPIIDQSFFFSDLKKTYFLNHRIDRWNFFNGRDSFSFFVWFDECRMKSQSDKNAAYNFLASSNRSITIWVAHFIDM